MDLNKTHRTSLINQLNEINQKIEVTEGCMENVEVGNSMKYFYEIQHFIQKATKELIEQALIENEIDY